MIFGSAGEKGKQKRKEKMVAKSDGSRVADRMTREWNLFECHKNRTLLARR